MSMASQHIWNIILACGFTSTAIHLFNQRRESETQRLRFAAHIGALEDVLRRLRAGERISDEELAKIRRRVGLAPRINPTDVTFVPMQLLESTKDAESKPKMNAEEELAFEWNKGEYLLVVGRTLTRVIALDEASKTPSARPSLLRALLGMEAAQQAVSSISTTPSTTPAPSPGVPSKKPVFY
ncbi:SubName: Full=Uncharacterized protein {ECO:0000313/EMBL:CCA72174.1} [Serendipita indica DSM 11827]|uniref:Uncharacterized protein n=1 Tax=Serendipita indica (strain DSM 11827) TaxID=1109443 RepID=G4TLI1_SERID|nr:SubName: Full=Uncharacterized protein {ECO:0000313/EMBL:CCA72174.1} [Serendipita indica DSM 11827]CCA72174.1 hypothetical protein PIIN_06109 [Serendipita indica DSM 11827]